MALDQTDVIDFISGNKDSKEIVLYITDHYEWGEEDERHLLLLQDKINVYLGYIESGEILEKFPYANDKKKVIKVIGKFELTQIAKDFFKKGAEIIRNAGYDLIHEVQKD
jgi:hypothetical protein